jgi:hypothetical protein
MDVDSTMSRLSRATKNATKKTAVAVGRGTGRLIKKTVKSGYAAGSKRDRRRAG